MQSATVTVSSTAVPIVGSGAVVPGGQRVLIRNSHAKDVLIIGGPDVARDNGYGIAAGLTLELAMLEWAGRLMSSGRSVATEPRSPRERHHARPRAA
jgi:hypothetical protein